MAFFTNAALNALEIEQMVFHLVGPDGFLVRLEAIDPGTFADFFLDRIRSVNAGLPYRFSDASAARTRLARIAANGDVFQLESEGLATDFQALHGRNTAAGAFMVFVLRASDDIAFALLKYDDEQVLGYELAQGGGGRQRPNLEALERTFVQNKDALQKSALIRLTEPAGELMVLDRRNQQRVARYFETFLGASRVHEDTEATLRLVEATRKVIRENPELVPPQVYKEQNRRTFDAAARGGRIAIDGHRGFLEAVVGAALADEDPLLAKFDNALKSARLDGMPLRLDAAKVSEPAGIRLTTANQIQIRVPADMVDRVTVEKNRIIINDRVAEQVDDTGRAR